MSDVSQQLLAIPSWCADLQSLRLTPKQIDQFIKRLEDFLVEKFSQLSFTCDEFQTASSLVGCYASLMTLTKSKLLNAVVSGLARASKLLASTTGSTEREPFEAISILAYAVVQAAEKDYQAASGGSKKVQNDLVEWNHLKIALAESLKTLCSAPSLPRLYQTYSDLEHLTAHLMVENPENCKIAQLRALCGDVLAICGTSLPCKHGLQIIVTQDLNYLEHLAEFNAEVLSKMSTQFGDSTMLDSTLQYIGSLHFNQDDAAAAKIICTFILKLAISDTRNVLRNVASIADCLDSDVYSVRMSMLEVFAILYCHLMLQDERSDQSKAQARGFLTAIEERLRDVNSFVRSKVLHVLTELIQANALPVAERARLLHLVVGRVMDKSSNVRRRAIQLLAVFLRKHPFCVDGGELSLSFFEERLVEIERQLELLEPTAVKRTLDGSSMEDLKDTADHEEGLPMADELATMQSMQNLLLQKRYYSDAIEFVKEIDAVMPVLCRLLSSNTKTEVFEVMDFFVDAHAYRVQSSQAGIKKMMHLIWEQDLSTEDGTKRSVKEHVLANYRRVLLEVDVRLTGKEKIVAIARNLIELVRTSSVSDLASLEQIVMGFMKKEWITDATVQAIAFVFSSKASAIADQRSALILLSMVGTFKPKVIAGRVEAILKIGLGRVGQGGDPWMAEYACVALRLVSSEEGPVVRLAGDNVIFAKLGALVRTMPATPRWLQVGTQAIKTLYTLADQPSVLAASWIHELSKALYNDGETGNIRVSVLIKLLHVAGHVAAAEVGHLDSIEMHWKEGKTTSAKKEVNGMEGVTATEEDDIVDAVRFVRESELLYGDESLLSVLGPLVVTVCSNSNMFSDPMVQNVAAMTLAKFMTVSGRFCDEHLPLFLTILEKSPDPIVRSNLTIAFADLAQSFGRIVDANIVYLFRRLRDADVSVKRNALLVLTHLTLTGLIKVKGQVGEIAKCILDEDGRVADLARLFFHELASKDNAIYNHIPDIISSLSMNTGANEQLSEEDFQVIVRFIFEYIKKERQMEGLLEKLCQRFRQCTNLRQARDLASCLALLNYSSERTIRRLVESLPSYKDKLVDPVVFRHFCDALSKARKGTKAELRTALDEYEQKIIQAAGEDISESLEQMSLVKSKKAPAKNSRGRRPVAHHDEETDGGGDDHDPGESDEPLKDQMNVESGQDELAPSPRKSVPPLQTKKKGAAVVRRPRRAIRMRDMDSDNDDDDIY